MKIGSLLIIICGCFWASDAIFRAPLSKTFDAATLVLIEHIIGICLTVPWLAIRRRELGKLGLQGWFSGAFIGLMGSAAGTVFFTASFRYLNPSVTILLQKTQPIFAVLGARLVLGEIPKPGFYKWGLLALAGSILVSLPEMDGGAVTGFTFNIGIAYALGASVTWGLSTVFGKAVTNRASIPVATALRYLFGFSGLLAFNMRSSTGLGSTIAAITSDRHVTMSVLYMALFPGVIAMYLYYAGLKRTRASIATFAELFFPVAAVIVNWKVLGEGLSPIQILGSLFLMIAVYFINK